MAGQALRVLLLLATLLLILIAVSRPEGGSYTVRTAPLGARASELFSAATSNVKLPSSLDFGDNVFELADSTTAYKKAAAPPPPPPCLVRKWDAVWVVAPDRTRTFVTKPTAICLSAASLVEPLGQYPKAHDGAGPQARGGPRAHVGFTLAIRPCSLGVPG